MFGSKIYVSCVPIVLPKQKDFKISISLLSTYLHRSIVIVSIGYKKSVGGLLHLHFHARFFGLRQILHTRNLW